MDFFVELGNMWSNFILADETLINKLNEIPREVLSDFLYKVYLSKLGPSNKTLSSEEYIRNMRRSTIKFVFIYCPNCNDSTLFCNNYMKMEEVRGLKFCINCGDSHFMEKATISTSRIKAFQNSINSIRFENGLVRTLHLQQLVVMIATQLECFLRDYYAAILNMRMIKFRKSAYQRFIKECKNDFLNPGKANKRLKDELNIDLKELIGKNKYAILNKLSDYRNVIVHNNELADRNFISNGNTEYSLGQELEIDDLHIDDFIKVFNITLASLTVIYSSEFTPILVNNINTYISDIINKSIYINNDNQYELIKKLI